MRNDNKLSRKEQRIQERKDFREYITVADKRVLDMKKSGMEPMRPVNSGRGCSTTLKTAD